MLRITAWLTTLGLGTMMLIGCSSDKVVDPPLDDENRIDTSASIVNFRIEGENYTLESIPGAFSSTAMGYTSISAMTRVGVSPVRYILIDFKLMTTGSYHLQNTGNNDVDDGLAVQIGDKSYGGTYYECNQNRSDLRRVDLGTVNVEVANRTTGRIKGTFSGKVAATTPTKEMCGPSEVFVWQQYPVTGSFDCAWGIL